MGASSLPGGRTPLYHAVTVRDCNTKISLIRWRFATMHVARTLQTD